MDRNTLETAFDTRMKCNFLPLKNGLAYKYVNFSGKPK